MTPASGRARLVDAAALLVCAACMLALAVEVARYGRAHCLVIIGALVAGYVGTDLISGVVHWVGDTWGTARTPLLGPTLIRGFRDHHRDPAAITRHGFLETNGANCLVAIPVALFAATLRAASPTGLFLETFLGAVVLWTFWTNQFHKWAHVDDPPALVRLLQRARVILPPEHHARHHQEPFTTHYCITTGWLNRPLAAIRLFARLERVLERLCALEARPHESVSASAGLPAGARAVTARARRRRLRDLPTG